MGTLYNFINVGVWNIHGLQETHCGPKDSQSLSVEGYRVFPYHKKISGNGRYFEGSIVLIKIEHKPGIIIVDSVRDDIIWLC